MSWRMAKPWRRGVVLSFASALLQALVAVAIVGIAAVLLGATRRAMDGTVWWIEVVSYGLIAFLGARLLWVKGRSFLNAVAKYRATRAEPAVAVAHHHDHGVHDHAAHNHAHDHADHDHVHGPSCSHHSHAQ